MDFLSMIYQYQWGQQGSFILHAKILSQITGKLQNTRNFCHMFIFSSQKCRITFPRDSTFLSTPLKFSHGAEIAFLVNERLQFLKKPSTHTDGKK